MILDGLVLRLPLDEGVGLVAVDKSGYGNDGDISGATWVGGKYGQALSFDGGNNYVNCGAPSVLNIRTAITVAAWVKPVLTGDTNQGICCKDDNSERAWNLRLISNKANFAVKNASDTSVSVTDDDALTADVWTHLVGTYDGETVIIYKDGVEVGSDSLTGLIKSSTDEVWLGAYYANGSNNFKGVIDEVRIYNRALGLDEVLDEYNTIYSDDDGSKVLSVKLHKTEVDVKVKPL